ncbi:MAG: peptide deformylase [Bdellovibrionales bacterium]|jgi:peptide deformylase|nr:peptide deformylase [Bdellovibrionales bacterium]
MKLEVLRYPDPRLRKKGLSVTEVTDEHRELVKNMIETMYDENGIGLAAPQVGESLRLLVIDTRPTDENGTPTTEGLTDLEKQVQQPIAIFNPEIVVQKDKTTYEEGCLSVPGFFDTVERAQYVEVKGLDENGKEILIKTDGLLAICLQHEMDHLEGKLFIDRLSFIKSNKIKNKIKKSGYPTPDEVTEERQKVREARAARRSQDEAGE